MRAAQLSGIKRAVIAKTPQRMSGQPLLRNTSYVDGQFDRIDQTRVRGVIRAAILSLTESLDRSRTGLTYVSWLIDQRRQRKPRE